MEVEKWLVDWFSDKLDCSAKEIDINVDFFEEEYIDSLKIFELIMEIEYNFNIKFNNNDFLDKRVHSISGLINLINSKQ